ncbi:MAG: 4-hydroxy-tetrahydrodipicolinate synthase [Acidimicrobiales bacterium]
MTGRFGSVLTAMLTPFDANGALDLDVAQRVARWLVEQGNDGLVVAGTTGESPTLTDVERLDLIKAVAEAVTVPVIAGTGTNDTPHSVALTEQAAALGAAAVLVVCPYYNKPPQAGLEAHFRACAAATQLPVVLYDVPGRTGKRIATDVLVRLFRDVANVVAFKDATGDLVAAASLVHELGDGIEIYSGDDALTLPLLAVGAVGVVGVATHWCSSQMAELVAAYAKGDVVRAREVNGSLLESFAFANTEESNYSMTAKAMLRTLGLPVGECRLPLPPTPPGVEDRCREVYARLHA